jgi:hypothetical protein
MMFTLKQPKHVAVIDKVTVLRLTFLLYVYIGLSGNMYRIRNKAILVTADLKTQFVPNLT